MVAGTLAITGVGVIGSRLSPAFIPKDAILESAFASGSVHGTVAFFLGIFAALLTSFYSWRLIFLTFFGKARWAGSEHISTPSTTCTRMLAKSLQTMTARPTMT
jgi:NADH-quinone oxidoreductase subunit L